MFGQFSPLWKEKYCLPSQHTEGEKKVEQGIRLRFNPKFEKPVEDALLEAVEKCRPTGLLNIWSALAK